MTKIEWTDEVWNPVTGCTKIATGCKNCYAERMAKRLRGRCGYPADEPFKVTVHYDRLRQPLRWSKPRKVFVCSMGDLFHGHVSNSYIQAVFTVMAQCRQHTFQILTKRPTRMRATISRWVDNRLTLREGFGAVLPNVWLGVSASTQSDLELLWPDLRRTPAAKRFISLEPLLGPIDLRRVYSGNMNESCHSEVDCVIVGAESGPRRRECNNQWIASIVRQCVDSDTPVFVKQANEGGKIVKMPEILGRVWDQMPTKSNGPVVERQSSERRY
jgi:protein gp37